MNELPEKWRAWYDERAAILEFCAGMTRKEAEAKALWLVQKVIREAGEKQGSLLDGFSIDPMRAIERP